jgi:hypothetical protein
LARRTDDRRVAPLPCVVTHPDEYRRTLRESDYRCGVEVAAFDACRARCSSLDAKCEVPAVDVERRLHASAAGPRAGAGYLSAS